MYKNVDLKNKERYGKCSPLSKEKLERAVDLALYHIDKNIDKFQDNLCMNIYGWYKEHPMGFSYNCYQSTDKVRWENGMWTGLLWLAYLYTGNNKYRNVAESHMKHYVKAAQNPAELNDHDTGFKFTPSCVAAYKITGNREAKEAALRAAEIQLAHYCPTNKFIIRIGTRSPEDKYTDYRTLVDSMMNIPLFFWAYEETGNKAYYDAAVGHYQTTAKYLIREDGSSYHHYQFDPVTFNPVGGKTFQGKHDESCWTRGQSWLISGYPLAYKYTKDEEIINIHKAVSYYFMDNLPKDGVPFWDFDCKEGCFEPRDSSASAIAACGLMEMCKYLPDTAEQKPFFRNAADLMLNALIDTCANSNKETDCLLSHVTGALHHNKGIDDCAMYGDYFYFEALVHALKPEIEMFW